MIFVDRNLYSPPAVVDPTLENNSWRTISRVSERGDGANYWAIGDKKNVHLTGSVGTIQLDNTFQVFIIGFDHNKDLEGGGITFQGFKNHRPDHDDDTDDVVIVDEYYNTGDTPGGQAKTFSMNHGKQSASGGWKYCDLRYDILGSTNVFGGDAGNTTATDPVDGTLMSTLPTELRKVLKPMDIYSNNAASETSQEINDPNNVTKTTDYLPLLSAYEINGDSIFEFDEEDPEYIYSSYINVGERDKQEQYKYYFDGGSPIRVAYTDETYWTGGYGNLWWVRSMFRASFGSGTMFCSQRESLNPQPTDLSLGLSVIFRV
jgi:hypothetical protein